MSYLGFYQKEVISFLKQALATNYKAKIFMGGRGPASYRVGSMLYINEAVSVASNFNWFDGKESVCGGGQLYGFHAYSGMGML